jgi:hypothetical protein
MLVERLFTFSAGSYFILCLIKFPVTQDHGIQRDGTNDIIEPQNDQLKRSLLQDLNRHAAVVLEGRCISKHFQL